jgi:prepilin-type N-terminal cleavage/methylation domain-containing protein
MNSSAVTCSSTDRFFGLAGAARASAGAERGYTIIEVMIAIAIFSIGILGAWALQNRSTSGNASARNLTIGASCAADRLEQLIQLPYAHADLLAGDHAPAQASDGIDNDFDGEIDEPGESGPLRIAWLITDDAPIPQTKTIRVDVTMREKTIRVTSYRANL